MNPLPKKKYWLRKKELPISFACDKMRYSKCHSLCRSIYQAKVPLFFSKWFMALSRKLNKYETKCLNKNGHYWFSLSLFPSFSIEFVYREREVRYTKSIERAGERFCVCQFDFRAINFALVKG